MEKVVCVALEAADSATLRPPDVLGSARSVFADSRYRDVSVHLPRRDVEHARDSSRGGVLTHTGAAAGPGTQLVALVSLWVDSADDLTEVQRFLTELSDNAAAFTVTETVARWWPQSGRSAALNAMSLLRRNRAMNHEQFLTHWAHVHMPISLRHHPQWKYVRNPVVRCLFGRTDLVPDAIAEEGFANAEDLIDPMRFYGAGGDPQALATNKAIVFDDVPVFIDVATTLSFITEEHVLRSAWTPYADTASAPPQPFAHGRR